MCSQDSSSRHSFLMRPLLGTCVHFAFQSHQQRVYLEDQGDVVSRIITPPTHIEALIIPLTKLLSPSDPPSIARHMCEVKLPYKPIESGFRGLGFKHLGFRV